MCVFRIPVSEPGLARHAVLLTAPTVDPRLPRFAQLLCNVSSFGINTSKRVSKQATLSTFRINTYEKQAGWGRGAIAKQPFHRSASRNELVCFQTLAHSLARRKTQLFYFQALPHSLPKTPGGGGTAPVREPIREPRDSRVYSLPHRFLTSLPLGAHRAPLATLLHPWHANGSANTFLPISTGAKKSRAPFTFRRTPLRPSQATSVLCESRFIRTNIVGSKLVPGTVK